MAANTYPDPRVTRMVHEFTVPVQFNVVEDPGARARYHGYWTPCLIYQDVDGGEYRRSFGSLNVEQFLAEFSLGRALRYVNSGQFQRGLELLEEAVQYTEAVPLRHAENMYWIAVARYKTTDDADYLLKGWAEMQARHPGTEWAVKSRQLAST